MREINTVAMIGMGALGMLFGERLQYGALGLDAYAVAVVLVVNAKPHI